MTYIIIVLLVVFIVLLLMKKLMSDFSLLGISLFDLATTDKIGRDRIFEESIRAAERRIINKEITVLRKLQNYLLKDMSPESDLIFDQLIIQLQKELVDSEVSDNLEVNLSLTGRGSDRTVTKIQREYARLERKLKRVGRCKEIYT